MTLNAGKSVQYCNAFIAKIGETLANACASNDFKSFFCKIQYDKIPPENEKFQLPCWIFNYLGLETTNCVKECDQHANIMPIVVEKAKDQQLMLMEPARISACARQVKQSIHK
ncbi:hypothetical protein KIN20_013787 [Parelaphostrongylus tenuis]|uniref:Uncharacterized protein n=1 Tax=Parelaphostrongylus tenuis TaxID=148309 RepID=A0AAD5MYL6_PARTN|nr:hypothetical protein KIN20_013787 [Parelaphostrongylus tenuis]